MIAMIFLLLLLFPVFAFAQQPATCEQSLAQTQARLEFIAIGRENSESLAAQVTAGLRQQNSELQAKVKDLEAKVKTLEAKTEPTN